MSPAQPTEIQSLRREIDDLIATRENARRLAPTHGDTPRIEELRSRIVELKNERNKVIARGDSISAGSPPGSLTVLDKEIAALDAARRALMAERDRADDEMSAKITARRRRLRALEHGQAALAYAELPIEDLQAKLTDLSNDRRVVIREIRAVRVALSRKMTAAAARDHVAALSPIEREQLAAALATDTFSENAEAADRAQARDERKGGKA